MDKKYNTEGIAVLGTIEAVRKRPEMFIGSVLS